MFKKHEILSVPSAFVALFAFVYVTGYLIDFFYFSNRGVSDIGGELLKLRYIQVGIYFVLSLALFVGIPFFIFFAKDDTKLKKHPLRPVGGAMAWAAILYQVSLFLPTLFAPPDYFSLQNHPWRYYAILALVFSVLIVYVVGRKLAEVAARFLHGSFIDFFDRERPYLGWIILLLIVVSDALILPGLFPLFLDMLPNVLFFVGFCLVSAWVLALVYDLLSQVEEWDFRAIRMIYLTGSLMILLLFFILLSYALTIFPFIPNTRGGADLRDANRVSVIAETGAMPRDFEDTILIYSTATSFFFAKPDSVTNNACTWQQKSEPIANLIQVRREQVKSISMRPRLSNCLKN